MAVTESVSRMIAAALEQNHDENGIIFPFSLTLHHPLGPLNMNRRRSYKKPKIYTGIFPPPNFHVAG